MSPALGLHRLGDRVLYALVERLVDQPPQVLEAGEVAGAELPALYRHLRKEWPGPLPWALADEHEGQVARRLEAGWTLRRPAPQGFVHPAAAAALWEWELGRVEARDLFLWLRPERLLWSHGPPEGGQAGSVPRRGPLHDSVRELLQRFPARDLPVAAACHPQAPGAESLTRALEDAGCRVRPLAQPAIERGADRAAAGAALGALEPERRGLHPPAGSTARDPVYWIACALALAGCGAAQWLEMRDPPPAAAAPLARSGAAAAVPPAAAVPGELSDLLLRRQALLRALEILPLAVPPGTLQHLEVVTGAAGRGASLRLEVQGAGGDPAAPTLGALPGEMQLRGELSPDGSRWIYRGQIQGGDRP